MKRKKRPFISACCLSALFLVFTLSGCGLFVRTIPKGEIPGRTPQDHYVMIEKVNFHYLEYPGPGRDVLLLHGFASSTYTWEKVIPHLSAQGYHVWALDMKGFGWSDKPEPSGYDPVTLTEEVNRWMEVMGLKDLVFAGNSLGGAIGLLLALEHPDKIDRLILIDSAGYPIQIPLVIRMAKMPFAAEIGKLFFGRWAVRSALREVLYDDDLVTEEKVEEYFRRMSTENAMDAQTALARSLDFEALRRYTQRIPAIPKRTLILWGENDEWIPLASGHRFRKELRHSSLVVFPECGHIPQEEKPEETAKHMIDFIEKE